ncbi:MAG: phosphoribosylglycinamide formyltransferase [Acidocella sp. 20-63-7]|nr:MAG: phosphoribosylglycinamide formyltransferase [Acidocella sp. 20-63-7]HQT46751.1 phosphoribosylglycinamide formyltransferase [Acidocella sp.]
MKPRVAVFCSGRGSNMEALIRASQGADYPAQIVLVVSNKADAPALAFARKLGITAVAVPAKPFGKDREAHERAIDAVLVAEKIDIVCLAGYMRLLTPYLVGRWAGRMLNIHPSLLPNYPGLDTHARVLAAGEPKHGCTVHLVTEIMDDGPILAQAEVPVLPGDTEETLAARVLEQEHRIYPEALATLSVRIPLPEGGAKL